MFLSHPDGLVPREILCDKKILDEFVELWIEERPTKDDVGIEIFLSKGWQDMPTDKIHKMIAALNTSLAKDKVLSYSAFYQVRQLEGKKCGKSFFLPLYYLLR